MNSRPTIVWLRDDLRIADNPALAAAAKGDSHLVIVYVLDEESHGVRPHGGASRWWLHHSLKSLASDLTKIGGTLVLRRGDAIGEITKLVDETDAEAVYWNRRYTSSRDLDADLKHSLRERGLDVQSFQASLLYEPWTVTTGDGNPYRVFTPFWRATQDRAAPRDPIAAPHELHTHRTPSDDLDDWQLLPTKPDWAGGLAERWEPGEASAHRTLENFARHGLAQYDRRDEPALDSTSAPEPAPEVGRDQPVPGLASTARDSRRGRA